MRKLLFVTFICLAFMVCEVVGGIISGSLAILTDAAHMFSDVSGFLISYFAILISQNKSSMKKSMGYHRAEILGAILAIVLIWALLVWLLIEAYKRVLDPPDVDAKIMLITAIVGFISNLINFFALEGECFFKRPDYNQTDEESINPNELSGYFIGKANRSILNQELMEGLDNKGDIESDAQEGSGLVNSRDRISFAFGKRSNSVGGALNQNGMAQTD